MATTDTGIWYPEPGTNYNLNTILSTMASSIDNAISDSVYDSGWVSITPASTYTEGYTVRIRRVGPVAYLAGSVQRNAGGKVPDLTSEHVLTIPAGFRSASTIRWIPAGLAYATDRPLVSLFTDSGGDLRLASHGSTASSDTSYANFNLVQSWIVSGY